MKGLLIWIFCAAVIFFGCTPKSGSDELVYINESNKASDEIFIDFLTQQIEDYPEEADNYLKLADIFQNNGETEKAIELLQNANRENPENLAVLLELSHVYMENGDVAALAKTLNSIRKTAPDHIEFLKLSAGYSLMLNDYTNAVYFANRAMLTNPFDDEAMYLRGKAMLINLDSINALMSFEEAYKLKNSYKNFSTVFDLSLTLNQIETAGNYLKEFSADNSDQSLCFENGVYLFETGKSDTAKIVLKNCKEKGVIKPRTIYELAKIFLRENDTDSAVYYVNSFIDKKPEEIQGYILKAGILEKSNNLSDAKEFYLTALEIDSTNLKAIKGLENLERKVAYLQLIKRKENVQRQVETLKPLNSKQIN